jgi:hypothetical protein
VEFAIPALVNSKAICEVWAINEKKKEPVFIFGSVIFGMRAARG